MSLMIVCKVYGHTGTYHYYFERKVSDMVGRDKTKKDTYMVKTLLNMFKRKQIDKNHPLQRKPDQWTDEAESGLVASVIKGEDIDSLKICEQIIGDTFVLWLIDGLQRLTVLEKYNNNAFKTSNSLEMPFVYFQKENEDGELDTVEYDLRGKYYRDLPEELQDAFDSYAIDVVKHLDCSNEEVAYHIARYNRQTSMNVNQKNILPMYKVACFIKKISDGNEFFKECGNYTQVEIRKGVIERVVSESIMTMFHLDKWTKGKTMSKFLNENATEEEFDILESELNRLCKIIDKKTTGQLFNSKNSFIWFAAFHKFTSYKVKDERFKDFLVAFQNDLHTRTFKEYDNESFDTYDNGRSTKDKKVVFAKLDMLDKLMREYLHIEDGKTSEEPEVVTPESFISEMVDMPVEKVEPVMEIYEETLDGLEDNAIRDGSKLLDDANRLSLLAMVAYSYKNDVDLDDWLEDYAANNNMYYPDQRKNYLHMISSLQQFQKRTATT